jgi:hypothetical protein
MVGRRPERPILLATTLATALAALLILPARSASQELPAHLDEGLFEVLVPGLGALTTPALVDTAQVVYVPLAPVLVHAGYEVDVAPGHAVWRAGVGAPDSRLMLDPPRYLGAEGENVPLPPGSVVLYAGEVFVSTAVLASVLGADVTVDWGALRVVVTRRDPPFPAQVRARLEARRAAVVRPARAAEVGVEYQPRSGGMIFDWSVGTSPFERRVLARAALGAAVLGGDLTLAGAAAAGRDAAPTAEVSYRRIFPGRRWINQLHLGQVLTQDLAPRSIIGAVVSNIPQQRDAYFGEMAVSPDIPEGWEFEVYQAGRLVGFSTAGVDRAVFVPVRYGQTPVEVRMVGPAGEEVVTQHRYRVPISQLPSGRTEYSAGAGVCPQGRCDAIGYAELRRGFGHRLTMGGGVQAVSEEGALTVRPTALASFVPDRHWAMDLEARPQEFVRASVDRVGDDGRHLGVSGSVHQPAFGEPSFLLGSDSRWQIQARAGLHPFHVTGRIDGQTGEGVDRVRVGVGRSLSRGFGQLAVEAGSFGENRLTGRATTILPERWWAFHRPVALSGSFSAGRPGLRLLEVSSSLRPRPDGYLTSALQWNGARNELYLTLSFRQVLNGARVHAAAARRGGTSTLTMSANGSVAVGGVRGAYFGDRDLQGRAGVVGRVYYDRNGNQRFDEGDEPAAGVAVLVGGVRTRTDADGYYRAWNVTPYEVTAVAVDTLSGIDPSFTVLAGGTLLRPVPHLPNRVDFPLAETRELLGRVETGTGHGVGGVEIELHHLESDRLLTVRTFSDGTFYVSRLLPGVWLVRVARASLDALGVGADPDEVRLDVNPERSGHLLEIDPFVLREEPAAQSAPGP